MIIQNNRMQFGRVPGGGLGCLIFAALLLVAGYYVLKGLYFLLWWAAPALLVLALIVNWRVFPRTITSWLDTLETRPVHAIIEAAFAVIAFPFFTLWLFLKAAGTRQVDRMQRPFRDNPARQDEYTDYEEIDSKPGSGG
jgi:hypothetical protein